MYQKLHKRGQTTSAETAKIMVDSGEHLRQLDIVFRALKKCGHDITALELSFISGLDRYMISRRLPDLYDAGVVVRTAERDRKCLICKTRCFSWRVKY